EVERLRRAFAATSDEGEHKRMAGDIHRRVAEAGFYMPLGQFVAASAWRSDLTDVPTGPAMFLWGIGRGQTGAPRCPIRTTRTSFLKSNCICPSRAPCPSARSPPSPPP